MPDPLDDHDQLAEALNFAAGAAQHYLGDIDQARILCPGFEKTIDGWTDAMPETGDGTLAALRELATRGASAATRSSGPRFFHFVMGGGTPAALGADWLTSTYDQVAFAWASSPLAARLEQVALDWFAPALRAAARVRRRIHERSDDGQLRRLGCRAQLVGGALRR